VTGDLVQAPTATYRLQVNGEFGFVEAAGQVDYLEALGVSHVYLSPVLEPTPGSAHGYDVVDHSRLNTEAGGRRAFDALVAALHAAGMGAVADVVPNHMAVPAPAYLNAPLWAVLREGTDSPYARWFDVDWSAGDGRLLMPVLGADPGRVLADGQLVLAGDGGPGRDECVLRYFEHELPVRAGTQDLPLGELLERQWYRLAHWEAGGTELNYRRFFDVTSLVAVRVEDPEVFEHSHSLLRELVEAGALQGLRIDHPDGLADPAGYLRRLADTVPGAWVVVEKILEGDEQLPVDWACAGTTGYDTLMRVGGLFVDPDGEAPLRDLLAEVTGERTTLDETVTQAKEQVVESVQTPEVDRLVRLLVAICDADPSLGRPPVDTLRRVIVGLLVAVDRYRAYVVPGRPAPQESAEVLGAAAERAGRRLPEGDRAALELVRDLALCREVGSPPHDDGPRAEFAVRFQQTCGPVMAKGIEDTAFYRWFLLVALNEVGGDPDHFGVAPEELNAFAAQVQARWPGTMTTLSTHDTKRSEDVRARLAVLSEMPQEWAAWLAGVRELTPPHCRPALDPGTEYLLWQTLAGSWPIDAERLGAYAVKAVREAKRRTTWAAPDEDYESAVRAFVDGVLGDDRVLGQLTGWADATDGPARANVLGQKLLQLVMPGVPDVYQGTELVDLSLVDPDNRRAVDFAERRSRLARLDDGGPPQDLSDEKLLVTSRALRLRRDRPDWFGAASTWAPVPATSRHALAVGRGAGGVQAVAVLTRLAASLDRDGGWRRHRVAVPQGRWRDVLTDRVVDSAGHGAPLGELLSTMPVALLVQAT